MHKRAIAGEPWKAVKAHEVDRWKIRSSLASKLTVALPSQGSWAQAALGGRTSTPVVANCMRLSELHLHQYHGPNNAASVGGLHSDALNTALAIGNAKRRFIRLYHETTKASGAAGDIRPHPGTW